MVKTTSKRQEVTCYSRVNGWYVPVKNFNKGKASEWNDRKTYIVE